MDQNDTTTLPAADAGASQPPVTRRGLGAASAAFLAAMGPVGAMLANPQAAKAATVTITDFDILNFALNLEYLEAEYYLRAVTGQGLPTSLTTGTGAGGGVNGGAIVPFTDQFTADVAANLALDEQNHVAVLRAALTSNAVARPLIDLAGGFQGAASAAGILGPGQQFNPFGSQTNFLIGAFVLEDVGVTAYAGAAALITNKTYTSQAAGILAVEAFHGGVIRSVLAQQGGNVPYFTQLIANLRAGASGANDDQGVLLPSNLSANIAPTDGNGLVYTRTPAQVINVVTLGTGGRGGFFPNGLNGTINSAANTYV